MGVKLYIVGALAWDYTDSVLNIAAQSYSFDNVGYSPSGLDGSDNVGCRNAGAAKNAFWVAVAHRGGVLL
jgi:hypothetical protein